MWEAEGSRAIDTAFDLLEQDRQRQHREQQDGGPQMSG